MADGDVRIKIYADGAVDAEKNVSSLGRTLKGLGGILAGVGLASFAASSVKEFQAAREASINLESVIKSTGMAAGLTAQQIGAMADELQKTTNFEADAIKGGQAILATFTSIGKDAFKPATEAALNMSQVLGQDLKGSMIQVGKALNDPIQGMTALRRAGVSFTEAQKQQIEALQKSGDLLGAQTIVLKELEKEFGGAAAAAADPMKQLANMWGDLKESIGELVVKAIKPLMPVLNTVVGVLNNILPLLLPVIDSLAKTLIPVIEQLIPYIKDALKIGVEIVGKILTAAAPIIKTIFSVLGQMMPIFTKLMGALMTIMDALGPVVGILADMIADMLPDLLPMLNSLVDLVVQLAPLLQVLIPASVQILATGLKFMNTVGYPFVWVLQQIIALGASAARLVNSIFGGGEGGGRKAPMAATSAFSGAAGGAVGQGAAGGAGGGGETTTTGAGGGKKDEYSKMIQDRMAANAAEVEMAIAYDNAKKETFLRNLAEVNETNEKNYQNNVQRARNEIETWLQFHRVRTTEEKKAEEARLAAEQMLRDEMYANMDAVQGIMGNIGSAAESLFGQSKEIAIAQALISTYVGAAKALELGPILGPIMMASVIAAGLAQVAKIAATKPGSGASGGGGGASAPSAGASMQGARIPAMNGASAPQIVRLEGSFGFKDGALYAAVQRDVALTQQASL